MLALCGSRVSFNMTFKNVSFALEIDYKVMYTFCNKRMKCCVVKWCDVMWWVKWCGVVWSDVMLCEMMWCCVKWYDVMCEVMWCDTIEFRVSATQCWVISSMDAKFLWKRLQTTNQGQRIGSCGRTRHRRTTKGRSIHNSSWVMDIGWQQRKVSLLLYIVTNGGSTIYR